MSEEICDLQLNEYGAYEFVYKLTNQFETFI